MEGMISYISDKRSSYLKTGKTCFIQIWSVVERKQFFKIVVKGKKKKPNCALLSKISNITHLNNFLSLTHTLTNKIKLFVILQNEYLYVQKCDFAQYIYIKFTNLKDSIKLVSYLLVIL